MDEKQKLIMGVAQKCFNNQGIDYTSIGQIVKECKISKATFYKYFSTKENLVWEMLFYSEKKFADKLRLIDEEYNSNPKEMLKKKVSLILRYISDNKSFNSQIIGEFSEIKGRSVKEIRNKIRSNILTEYYSCLIALYGNKIESIVWELIFVLDSLIHEFSLVNRLNCRKISEEYIENFVIRYLDTMVEILKDKEPTINKSIFYPNEKNGENSKNKLIEKEVSIIIKNMFSISEGIDNKKIKEAIIKIEDEIKSKQYNSLTMDAMIAYLEKEDLLKEEIKILKDLKSELDDNKSN